MWRLVSVTALKGRGNIRACFNLPPSTFGSPVHETPHHSYKHLGYLQIQQTIVLSPYLTSIAKFANCLVLAFKLPTTRTRICQCRAWLSGPHPTARLVYLKAISMEASLTVFHAAVVDTYLSGRTEYATPLSLNLCLSDLLSISHTFPS